MSLTKSQLEKMRKVEFEKLTKMQIGNFKSLAEMNKHLDEKIQDIKSIDAKRSLEPKRLAVRNGDCYLRLTYAIFSRCTVVSSDIDTFSVEFPVQNNKGKWSSKVETIEKRDIVSLVYYQD